MVCQRCGGQATSSYISKRKARGLDLVCQSCAARKHLTLRTAYGICFPHQGSFDENENPLDKDGKLLMAGKRLCGYLDCCNPEHIVLGNEKE